MAIFFVLLLRNSKKCSNFAVANQKFADILYKAFIAYYGVLLVKDVATE